jgi:hypothetical protein
MSELKDKIALNIHKGMDNNMLSNNDLVHIIEHQTTHLKITSAIMVLKNTGIYTKYLM